MGRKFGIEVENASRISHVDLAIALKNAGLNVDDSATGSYESNGYRGWQVKYDGSIRSTRNHRYKIELVSPPLEINAASFKEVRAAIKVARVNGKVNRSCGLHVHVDAADFSRREIARVHEMWSAWGPTLFSMISRSRRRNRYCRYGISREDRYVAINLVPFASRGTIEFRFHQGSLNSSNILAWVVFCAKLLDFVKSDKLIERLSPDLAEPVKISRVVNGQEFVVEKNGPRNWVLDGQQFETIGAWGAEIAKRINDPSKAGKFRRIFGSPDYGNAMTKICHAIGLSGQIKSTMEMRYEHITQQHGFFEGGR